MVKLAKHPNIHVKLGGLLMPLAGHELLGRPVVPSSLFFGVQGPLI